MMSTTLSLPIDADPCICIRYFQRHSSHASVTMDGPWSRAARPCCLLPHVDVRTCDASLPRSLTTLAAYDALCMEPRGDMAPWECLKGVPVGDSGGAPRKMGRSAACCSCGCSSPWPTSTAPDWEPEPGESVGWEATGLDLTMPGELLAGPCAAVRLLLRLRRSSALVRWSSSTWARRDSTSAERRAWSSGERPAALSPVDRRSR